ncbi:MliC family protein [Pseudomarimonas arenosa]|uniref:MliC family protein n=1 Tax=Pseudomarimonas arenosa TaxID=2774145 RepID=A0AAW3ZUD8_9GAMM|nr:MliC family protein [Pseudomarimonas arenosa]MBD8527932.1 MliC family protein [Pseudomarimonas arenosa]
MSHSFFRCTLLIGLVSLAGCISTPPRADSEDTLAGAGLLRGKLLLPPGSSAPPGARLRLSLLDRFSDGAELTAREYPLDSAPPIDFRLTFDRRRISDVTVYRLDAAVYGPDGRLLFTSDGEHPVNLGVEAEPTRIELMAIDSQSQGLRSYDCEGLPLAAEFVDPDLMIEIGSQQHRLRRAHAASGARYIGANAEFWINGDEARLQLGDHAMQCSALGD